MLIVVPCGCASWCQVAKADWSDDFEALWGHKWAPTAAQRDKAKQGNFAAGNRGGGGMDSAAVGDAGRLVAAVVESGDAWLVLGLHGCALLSLVAGGAGGRAYHALTSLGLAAGLLAYRHLCHPV